MAIYFIFYTLLCTSFIFSYNKQKLCKLNKNAKVYRNIWFTILLIFIIIVVGFRHPSMGVDLQYGSMDGYIGGYKYISSLDFLAIINKDIKNYEKGYVIFNKLISYISNNEQWLLFCTALLSIIPIFLIYNTYSENLPFSIIVYMGLTCFLATFSALRQSIAVGICIGSFYFIKNKKIIPFILLVLLATTFHSSALVFLFAYPLYRIKISRTFRWLTLLVIPIVFFLRTPLFYLLAPLLKENAIVDNNGAITLLIVFILIYIFCIFFGNPEEEEQNGFLSLLLMCIICQCFGNIHSYAARIAYYYMPFIGLLLPKVCKNFRGKYSIVTVIIVSIFIVYGLFSIYSSGNSWAQAYPWVPFWK